MAGSLETTPSKDNWGIIFCDVDRNDLRDRFRQYWFRTEIDLLDFLEFGAEEYLVSEENSSDFTPHLKHIAAHIHAARVSNKDTGDIVRAAVEVWGTELNLIWVGTLDELLVGASEFAVKSREAYRDDCGLRDVSGSAIERSDQDHFASWLLDVDAF